MTRPVSEIGYFLRLRKRQVQEMASSIVAEIVCPLLGVLISNAMALAPLPALLKARKEKELGDLNPVPFGLIFNSQFGWTLYGLLKRNYYIFFSSAVPMLVSLMMSLTAIHLLERPDHTEVEQRARILLEGKHST